MKPLKILLVFFVVTMIASAVATHLQYYPNLFFWISLSFGLISLILGGSIFFFHYTALEEAKWKKKRDEEIKKAKEEAKENEKKKKERKVNLDDLLLSKDK